MNIKKFTVSGFARFYHSLLRFNRDMEAEYALKITYSLYTSVNDIYRHKHTDVCITEYNESDFYEILIKTDKKPYKTIIQLYRAFEAAFYSIAPDMTILKTCQIKYLLVLINMMDDMEIRFRKAFGMKINDERTIYRMCAESLIPRRDEPGLCFIQDLNEANSA